MNSKDQEGKAESPKDTGHSGEPHRNEPLPSAATGDAAAPSGQSPSPHDSYFRYVFAQPGPARDLVLNVLRLEQGSASGTEGTADPIVSVTPQSPSFVDEKLREHRSDLLVTLQTASGRELAIYLLFEHKARNEPDTIYQLMRYNAVALAYLAKKRRKQRRGPPPIVSVVVYNGPGTWRAATELAKVLDTTAHTASGLDRLHQFRYLVFDVELGMSEHYVGGPVARTALQAMYAASRKLGREGVLAVVRSLTQAALPGPFREATYRYLIAAREDNAESILATLHEQGYTEVGAHMISYAERKHREGKAEGIVEGTALGKAEGKAEGLAEALIRQLTRRFRIDEAVRRDVRSVTDVEKLQAALDEIIEPEATRESVLDKLS